MPLPSAKEIIASARKRTNQQIELDYVFITSLYIKGHTQNYIAEAINKDPTRKYTLTQQQISLDIATIRERWTKRQDYSITQHTNEQLAKIDHLETTYWEHYERDKDLKALNGVSDCIEKRCKILGIYTKEVATSRPNVQVVFSWNNGDGPKGPQTPPDKPDEAITIDGSTNATRPQNLLKKP